MLCFVVVEAWFPIFWVVGWISGSVYRGSLICVGLCWGACSPALTSCVLLWPRESVPFADVCTVLLVSSLYRKLVLLFLIYILLTFDQKKKKKSKKKNKREKLPTVSKRICPG